jgi:hypothetical protein
MLCQRRVGQPKHNKKPHDRTLTTFGIDTMGASSVGGKTHIQATVSSLECCNLSNSDHIAAGLPAILARGEDY